MNRSRLKSMHDVQYKSTNKGVINTFIERWHKKTSFFHLPVGEMTIILNDVSRLLNPFIIECFIDRTNMSYTMANIRGLLRSELGIMMD